MIEDTRKTRKVRRPSKKVKKMHEEVVSKGILGATPPESKVGGTATVFTVGYYEDDKLKSKKNVSPSDLNIADMVRALNDNDYLIVKAFVRADAKGPTKSVFGYEIPGSPEEDYALYFKFKRTTKPKGINQTLEPPKPNSP